MRSNVVLRAAGLGLIAAVLAVATASHAQDFTNAKWIPLTRGGVPIGDPVGDSTGGADDARDVVGDAANPAAYVYQDASYFYFRLRVNGDPLRSPQRDEFIPFGWACAVESNGVSTNYEFLAAVNGIEAKGPVGNEPDQVEWWWNQTTTTADAVTEQSDVLAARFQRSTHARVVSAPSNFGDNPDFFIEWAIPISAVRNGGNGAPGIPVGSNLRFACGSANNARSYGADPACSLPNAQCTLTNTWSDPLPCGATSCGTDTDGDGVLDNVETALGTNPNDKDSDDDGIQDNVELSPAGGAGPYTRIDTDGDGTIDARDTDSDNDCALDRTEGTATYRNPALPSAQASNNCPATAPLCRAGACVACNGNFGSGATNACTSATAPKCNTTGPLAGSCTQCGPGHTSLCTGATPACNLSTGRCGACNGDFGSNRSQACPTEDAPACQTSGALAGRCTECSSTNVSECVPNSPACNTSTGTCAPCNGDRGSGATAACQSADAPYCNLANGTCGKCTADPQCGTGHTGPDCNEPTGACTDVDTDGDGVNDTVEDLLGTDKTKPDTDGDGINDRVELTPIGGTTTAKVDTDNDGIIDARDLDSDGDGLSDEEEGTTDVDSDARPNYRDPDDDDDGILTKDERTDATGASLSDDVDGDGKKNYYDTDADGDGIADGVEGRPDTNGNGKPEYLDPATGGDGGTDAGDGGGVIDGGGGGPDGSTSSSSSSSSGGIADAGSDSGELTDTGVLEGGGCGCDTAGARSSGLGAALFAFGAAVLRRRRRKAR